MKIAVLKEAAGETRCAAIPETVKKFVGLGAEVAVEKGAGDSASVSDADFEAAGGKLGGRAEVLKGAGIILCVDGPDPKSLAGADKGALLVGSLDPARRREAIEAYAAAAWKRWRWNGCRESPARSRWTSSRRSRTLRDTKR
jgi:NAD/NADP transhydrogenase alpha subunit